MSDTDPEVRLGYASSRNISFKGTWETGIPRSEWDEMSDKEKDAVMSEAMYDLMEVYELADDEEDVY